MKTAIEKIVELENEIDAMENRIDELWADEAWKRKNEIELTATDEEWAEIEAITIDLVDEIDNLEMLISTKKDVVRFLKNADYARELGFC